jgi:translocation and assembly module TamB
MQGDLNIHGTPLLKMDLQIPLQAALFPPQGHFLYDQKMQGSLFLSGRLEELLDFFDLGTHRIEGDLLCDFNLSGLLAAPRLYGSCTLSHGYYQNYWTGTELQEIEAKGWGEGNRLTLESLVAKDSQKKGSFSAKGFVELLPQKHFPFLLDLGVSRFNCATFDLITTEASGDLRIRGNLQEGALAEGSLHIVESDVTIPARIPHSLPDIQVIYKHAKAPIPETVKGSAYPLHLNLFVAADDGIFISGRGLESEWKGSFHIEGTQTEPISTGKIELIQGNFFFSGRAFRLIEGSLSMNGSAPPQINLTAAIQVKEIAITAQIQGPLNNPQIMLQSSPPLPMGTIVSYLLFGQDLAEISSAQAFVLASSIASFAGEGPGVVEKTQKSLGIDRIQLVEMKSATQDGKMITGIQVGKYIAEGVLVSYSQGAENSQGNISVEVEVRGNVSLVLESDQADEQKQGKFTLRWGHTY